MTAAAAAPMHEEEQPAGPMTWKEMVGVVVALLSIPLVLYFYVAFAMQLARSSQDEPARYSVELVGATGIVPAALAPGAAAPPAFQLLVRLDNGRIIDMNGGCGDVVVSYAGVPLARGRVPALSVGTKKVATVAVDATSGGVGIPEDLFRLMSEERRRSGVARLEVDLWLQRGLFTCRVDLHGERHTSECKERNFIYSS
ncbi:unnamed protein product [Urochloa decumbens]|uniref:Late embryogenesis abundant protein LEA-2 subgroup domain-containing protein n=1 Tax=Urochloa decumbens TaxID=240449 RepID=A0ABC9E0E5_9POAL